MFQSSLGEIAWVDEILNCCCIVLLSEQVNLDVIHIFAVST